MDPTRPIGLREEVELIGDSIQLHSMAARDERPYVPPTARIVRTVCSDCNNGWMSHLEAQMKEILTAISTRRQWRWNSDQLRAIRRWLIKTALMMEEFDPDTRLATADVYNSVRTDLDAPGSWYFGLTRVTGENAFDMLHSPLIANIIPTFPDGDISGLPARHSEIYAAQYMISINGFLFIVRYSPHPIHAPARLDDDLRIYPRGRPVSLLSSSAGARIERSKLPLFLDANIEDLGTWGHATRPNRQISLFNDGASKWVGLLQLGTDEHLQGYLAHFDADR